MQSSTYDDKGVIFFEEFHPKPFDTRKLQSGMFADRPDLWRKPARKQKPVPQEQLQLLRVRT